MEAAIEHCRSYKTYEEGREQDRQNRLREVGLVEIYRLVITPLKTYYFEMEPEVPNRVLRRWALPDKMDHFLRVTFAGFGGIRQL